MPALAFASPVSASRRISDLRKSTSPGFYPWHAQRSSSTLSASSQTAATSPTDCLSLDRPSLPIIVCAKTTGISPPAFLSRIAATLTKSSKAVVCRYFIKSSSGMSWRRV